MTPIRKPVRILRGLHVDEISAVDRAANGGAKILLAKRDDRTEEATMQTSQQRIAHEMKGLITAIAKNDGPVARNGLKISATAAAIEKAAATPNGKRLLKARPEFEEVADAERGEAKRLYNEYMADIQRLVDGGMKPVDAEQRARSKLGDGEFEKIKSLKAHHVLPLSSDANAIRPVSKPPFSPFARRPYGHLAGSSQ
jgi:hypothetical protein